MGIPVVFSSRKSKLLSMDSLNDESVTIRELGFFRSERIAGHQITFSLMLGNDEINAVLNQFIGMAT